MQIGYATMIYPEVSYMAIPAMVQAEQTERKPPLEADRVIEVATEMFGVDREALLSHCRKPELVFPRQLCMEVMRRQRDDLKLREIGDLFNRDHSVVLHAKKCIQNALDTGYRVEEIEAFLNYPF